MSVKKRGLGKGLGALLAENVIEEESKKTVWLRISEIQPNRDQPRRHFEQESLAELAESISQHGILQPLLVRPLLDGRYQLIAGERRWRAAQMAGVSEVPVIIREIDEQKASELALVENLQREDLNPMEEADGYKTLMENYGLKQEEIAKVVNKSRPAVANALRLLNLPQPVAEMVAAGEISAGHARALLALPTAEEQIETAKEIIKKGLSVRDIEKKARQAAKPKKTAEQKAKLRDSFYNEVELALTEHLGRRVKVAESGRGGTLQIEFYSQEDLKSLANLLSPEK
jgi:ParB family chromosome partitioning protein